MPWNATVLISGKGNTTILTWTIIVLLLIPAAAIWIAALNGPAFRLRRKGYGAFATFALVSLLAATAIAASMTALAVTGFENVIVAGFFVMILPGIVALAGGACLVRVLPQRARRRRFGRRSLSRVVTVCGIALMAFGALLPAGIVLYSVRQEFRPRLLWNGVRVSLFAVAAGYYLYHLRCRVSTSQAAVPDAAVLYLRAFSEESEPFAAGPKSKYGRFTHSFQSRVSFGDEPIWITFEDYFDEAVESLGPLAALGNPADRLPPDGALRVYEEDAEWAVRLVEMIRGSACILVQPGVSANLKWELELIRREKLHQKLFIFTRPEPRPSQWERWSERIYFRLCGKWPVRWTDFAAMLREAGYAVCDEDPGPGAVIGFDENGASMVLASRADLPSQFVQPVAARLACVGATTAGPAPNGVTPTRDPRDADLLGRVTPPSPPA